MATDQDLWLSIQNDDQRAFGELFHQYSSRIFKNVYWYVKDREVCEQIVHDIFLTLWLNRKTLMVGSFLGYLTAASRYRVYKHLKLRGKELIDFSENLEIVSTTTSKNHGYDDLVTQDLDDQLQDHLNNLPKRCREIFILSRKESLSNDEIAEKLHISRRSIENQITFALKHLRTVLKDNLTVFIICAILFHFSPHKAPQTRYDYQTIKIDKPSYMYNNSNPKSEKLCGSFTKRYTSSLA